MVGYWLYPKTFKSIKWIKNNLEFIKKNEKKSILILKVS